MKLFALLWEPGWERERKREKGASFWSSDILPLGTEN